MDKKSNSHSFRRGKKRTKKPQSNKLVDRLTFNPKKHKQKEKRNLRQQLQKKSIPTEIPKTPSTSLKFGSFNINGLDELMLYLNSPLYDIGDALVCTG